MPRTRARTEIGWSSGPERALGNLQLVLDLATLILALPLAARIHTALRAVVPELREAVPFQQHAVLAYLMLPTWLLLIVSFRLHVAVPQRIGQAELLVRLLKVHVSGFAALALLLFLTQSVINRSVVALFLLCTFIVMYGQRSLLIAWTRYRHKTSSGPERVLIVGRPSRRMAELVRRGLAQPDPPVFVGYLEAPLGEEPLSIPPTDAPPLPRVGALSDLPQLLHEQPVDHVLFFPPAQRPENVHDELLACEEVGVTASFSVDLVQLAEATPRVTSKYDHAFITFEVAPKRADALAIKYALDPLCALLLIVLTAPLFIAVAAAIWLTMSRPLLFVQQRAGLHGRPFRMLKFRTMRVGAERKQRQLLRDNEMSGPVFKMRDDPRVTPLGRFLRRTSLDELPQLFNVLTGSMSLVGPRPLPLSEQAAIRGWQRRRLTMKPGITCLWQVSGRNDVDFVDWMLLDLKYIQEWSLWLDVTVLLKTVPIVLLGRGAS